VTPLLLAMFLAGVAPSAPAATPVSQAELDSFVAGADQRDPRKLKALFGRRLMRSSAWVEHELSTPGAFLEAIDGCRRHRITRFPDAPDVYIQWVCPSRSHDGPQYTLPGYTVRLWHHGQLGLSLGFARDEIIVGPVPAPRN